MAQVTLPQLKTVDAIYRDYEAAADDRPSRRLGASLIGKSCDRAVWYDFRWADREAFGGRMLRLFDTGKREEARLIQELRRIGCEVCDVDERGEQTTFTDVGGHFVCKVDAIVLGLPDAPKAWHVAEFKTMAAKTFARLGADGLAKAQPRHLAQLLVGCHLAGVDRGIYIAVCKDTDELYAERIHADELADQARGLIDRARRIVTATSAPERIGDAEHFECRMCPHRVVCHGQPPPAPAIAANISCRTCCHATACLDTNYGRWACGRHGKSLAEPEQRRGCDDHLWLPDFVLFAEPTDGGDDDQGVGFVQYRLPDGATFRNSRRTLDYSSKELTVLPAELVGRGTVDAAFVARLKRDLDGVVVADDEMPF